MCYQDSMQTQEELEEQMRPKTPDFSSPYPLLPHVCACSAAARSLLLHVPVCPQAAPKNPCLCMSG